MQTYFSPCPDNNPWILQMCILCLYCYYITGVINTVNSGCVSFRDTTNPTQKRQKSSLTVFDLRITANVFILVFIPKIAVWKMYIGQRHEG